MEINLKRILFLVPVLLAGLLFTTETNARPGPDHKVAICHIPPGNPDNRHTIIIDWAAVPAHIENHGDYIGFCEELPPPGDPPEEPPL